MEGSGFVCLLKEVIKGMHRQVSQEKELGWGFDGNRHGGGGSGGFGLLMERRVLRRWKRTDS
jgi:hypothetical protein